MNLKEKAARLKKHKESIDIQEPEMIIAKQRIEEFLNDYFYERSEGHLMRAAGKMNDLIEYIEHGHTRDAAKALVAIYIGAWEQGRLIAQVNATHEPLTQITDTILEPPAKIYAPGILFPGDILKKGKRFTIETITEGFILGAGPTLKRAIETCVFDSVAVESPIVDVKVWKDTAQSKLLAVKRGRFRLGFDEDGGPGFGIACAE